MKTPIFLFILVFLITLSFSAMAYADPPAAFKKFATNAEEPSNGGPGTAHVYDGGCDCSVSRIPVKTDIPDEWLSICLIGFDAVHKWWYSLLRRTDVMIIFSINTKSGEVRLLHIPRDTYVYIPAPLGRVLRINEAFEYGQALEGDGFKLLKETIQQNMGIRVDYFMAVDYQDVIDITDYIGGVEIYADRKVYDTTFTPTLDLDVGWHHLDGTTSLKYLRSRKGEGDSDITRGMRQRNFIISFAKKLFFENKTRISGFLDFVYDRMVTDLTRQQFKNIFYALLMLGIEDKCLNNADISDGLGYWNGSVRATVCDGANIQCINPPKLKAFLEKFYASDESWSVLGLANEKIIEMLNLPPGAYVPTPETIIE